MYLVHFILVLVLEGVRIDGLANIMSEAVASFVALVPMTIVAFLLAWFLQKYVDALAINWYPTVDAGRHATISLPAARLAPTSPALQAGEPAR